MNFASFNRVNNTPYFQHLTSGYNNESLLYELVCTEGYNMHGVSSTFYVTSQDTSYDEIFGEDMDRTIIRKFECMVYYELPKEVHIFQAYGIDYEDIFHVYITKRHFTEASKYNSTNVSASYSSYLPKIGDLLKPHYNSFYYEVVSVKEEEQQFLQRKHTWDIIVRAFKPNGQSVSPEISATNDQLNHIMSAGDIFNISSTIESEKIDILYIPKVAEINPKEYIEGWD